MSQDRASAASGDVELHQRLLVGDDHALALVYDQHAGLVYGIARAVLGEPNLAADVTQEVFLSLWERPSSFQPDRGSLRAFLSLLARRRAIDLLRRRNASTRREEKVSARAPTPVPDVEETAATYVLCERLRACVDELPPEQRVAIELAYYHGLSYREVATRLGIPEGTAKSRMRLALERLSTALREHGEVQWA